MSPHSGAILPTFPDRPLYSPPGLANFSAPDRKVVAIGKVAVVGKFAVDIPDGLAPRRGGGGDPYKPEAVVHWIA